MATQSRSQKKIVRRVMHEYKIGQLRSGSDKKVRNPRQAIAIGLSEAGASNQQSPQENRRRLAKTKSRAQKNRPAATKEASRRRRK